MTLRFEVTPSAREGRGPQWSEAERGLQEAGEDEALALGNILHRQTPTATNHRGWDKGAARSRPKAVVV